MIDSSTLKKLAPFLYGVIAVLLLLPFGADLIFPLGTAIWVIYLLPTVLSYAAPRPYIPILVAFSATILTVIGFNLAPDGVDNSIAFTNRSLGVFVTWLIAATGYFFIRNRLAVQHQDWLQSGQVGLSDAVGGEQTVEELSNNALTFLAQHLGAQVGALYAGTEDGLRRFATYGVPSHADIPEMVTVGDGLLGQAARDQRSFVISPVPDGYLYFGSAMGQATPYSLLIAPTEVDGKANAIVELGFPAQVNTADAEALMQRVSSQLGVALRSSKYRARLRELLEETQQQAEELQAQAEELRANNEELEAQGRQLQEAAARLEAQQSELEQNNAELEAQTRQLEMQRDNLTKAQSSLESQATDLERATRYKSEFLANMSHELRTPLNSLLIMARLLAENRAGNLSMEQVRHAETIETAGNDLLSLINDILDISKIEAGKLDVQPRKVNIAAMMNKMLEVFQPISQTKSLNLQCEIGSDAPASIESDPQRLEQILKNFLSNAIKFTETGSVMLSAIPQGEDHIIFSVQDTGVGISDEQQQIIFDAFRQADGTVSRKYGGTGLGLSISRELALLLGGEVSVESEVGQGSTFSLILPISFGDEADGAKQRTALSRKSARPRPSPSMQQIIVEDDREHLSGDKRVMLIVEDDPAFAQILCDLAHEMGIQCLVANTADQGALMARQYLPDAVVLDMNLPDHTGLSVLDRIKRDVRTRHIPVHVVSVEDNSQTALSNGAIGYLFKPVQRDQLTAMLEDLEARIARRLRRVLVVEDDARQAESIKCLLATRDVETVEAHSIAECLIKLGSETFDCMVLDLHLPDGYGLDLLEQLSQDESVGFPPVIVYTGRDLDQDEELRLRKYSKSIIVKGAKSPERLLDEVTLFLHQIVSELPETQQKLITKSLGRDAALEGRNILVVEDDIRNVYSLTSILEPHGVKVRIARNGLEGLAALKQAGEAQADPIDLVLMDIMMPEMDGLAATRELRKQPWGKDIPIIALTAKAMARDQQDCLDAGANDYLAKPLDVDKLLSLIRVWMPR